MRRLFAGLAAVAAFASWSFPAPAQTLQKFALDRFEPSPAGDRFFAVPSADAGDGLRLMLLGDYAYRPLVLYTNDGDDRVGSVVSDQLFLHAALSLGLWERLNLSVNVPIALLTEGDSPSAGGINVSSPSGASFGDLRLGARVRLFGEPKSAAQLGLGASVWLPTGDRDKYTGENYVRGLPHLTLSGEGSVVAYGLYGGVLIRREREFLGTELGDEAAFGAALGFLAADKKLCIGPEIYGTTTLSNAFERDTVNAEAILGARYRVGDVVLGGGVGPGLTRGLGTPTLRGLLSLAWVPEPAPPPPPPARDRDHDGIFDEDDACPDTAGIKSIDPDTNGCPDTDEDGIFDKVDACPEVAGVKSEDPKKNGCPPDSDGDGILDGDDACPKVPGVENEDPKKNGCPPDRDGDGIIDDKDACPDLPGVESDDPDKNGCPPDTDGDGIRDDKDACPREKGKPDPDPKRNGCPTLVRVTKREIVILEKVQFKTASDVILKVSDELLTQVSAVLREHPEIKKIEVQGHTDNRGAAGYNQKLSERRARSVVKWLTTRGEIDAERLEAKGYGMDQPVSENTTEEGRAMNRRVQFQITSFDRPSAEKAE